MKKILNLIFILFFPIFLMSQEKESIAVIGIDCKGILLDNISMENMLRLELEKANKYEVLDKYDVANILEANNEDPKNCFGKTKLVKIGKLLNVDKIMTGNVDKFGDKIIFVLRMIDVKSEKITNTNVMEYIDLQREIQTMGKVSVNNIIGVINDPLVVDLLVNYERLVTSPKTTVRLNGPRMGASTFTGHIGERLQDPTNIGGYDMFPITSIFGFQYEVQYLSSGDFQALIEFVPAVSGLEAGQFIPSISLMNGFRFNKGGWELALGPIFRGTTRADGYYDVDGKWNLPPANATAEELALLPLENDLDSRGDIALSTSLVVAFGKTFRSGYLNVPLNIYFVPSKKGNTIGLVFGFNIAKKQKTKDY